MITLKEVLVATDLGSTSDATITYARSVAAALGARLHLIHVVDDLSARAATTPLAASELGRMQMELEADARGRLDAIAGLHHPLAGKMITAVVTSRRPATAILSYARDAHIDLIVAGTGAHHGLADIFMGSVAQELVRHAQCPVLTLRHVESAGPMTPVVAASKGAL